MTLATLKSMNLQMGDLQDALKIKPSPAAAPTPSPAPDPAPAPEAAATAAITPAVDPLQWWGALTQQFTEIAAKAVTDSTADAAKLSGVPAPVKAAPRKRRS
jgi:hypothetical protein